MHFSSLSSSGTLGVKESEVAASMDLVICGSVHGHGGGK